MSLANIVNKQKICLETQFPDTLLESEIAESNGGTFKIVVYNGEGTFPHFHVILNHNTTVNPCVELLSNTYFIHPHHEGTLSKDQRKLTDKLMRLPYSQIKFDKIYRSASPKAKLAMERVVTNYDLAVAAWIVYNPNDILISLDDIGNIGQPDYTVIHAPKKGI